MAVDRLAVQLALRTRLRTLSVCTTGITTLQATTTGYQRSAGSFLTDGFAAGMEVTPAGFTATTRGTITAVTATALTIAGGRTAEASASGRSLTVGLPALMGWENVRIVPVAGQPYGEEEFVLGSGRARTFPAADASIEETGFYVVRLYGPEGVDVTALRRYADAVQALFKTGTALAIATGVGLRVRSDVAPVPSPVRFLADPAGRAASPGWAVVTVSIPWRLEYSNT